MINRKLVDGTASIYRYEGVDLPECPLCGCDMVLQEGMGVVPRKGELPHHGKVFIPAGSHAYECPILTTRSYTTPQDAVAAWTGMPCDLDFGTEIGDPEPIVEATQPDSEELPW